MNDEAEPRGPKFRRRAEARPDEVLDAALALFIEKGFSATRVEDVARRAGLSKGAVYLYFPSKDALIEGLIRRAVLPVADSALEALTSYEGDPRIVISAVLKMVAQRLSDPNVLAMPKLIFRELHAFPALAHMYRTQVLDRILPAVEALIRRGIDQGYLREVDPSLTIRSIIGPLMLHLALSEVFGVTPEGGLHMDKLVDNHLSILFDGLSAPAGSKPASES